MKKQKKKFDAVIVDLPYVNSKSNSKKQKWDKPIDLQKMWSWLYRISKENCPFTFFSSGIFSAELMMSNKKEFRYDIIWQKGSKCTRFLNANRMPLRNHENILLFYRHLPAYNPQMVKGKPLHSMGTLFRTKENTNNNYGNFNPTNGRAGSTEKYPRSIISFNSVVNPIHPTEKPIALLEWLIKTYSNEGDLILDFCAGSGTTAIASSNCNRNCIAVEIIPEFYDMMKSRINSIN